MVVVDPDETYDPATDHVLMAARKGVDPAAPNVLIAVTPVVLNGEAAPRFVWKAGQRHRVRLINITPDDVLTFSMQTAQGPAHVDAADEGRRAAAGQHAHAGSCASDDCRRRDLRLRSPDGARPREPVD